MIKPIIPYYGGKRRIAKKVVPFIRENLTKGGTYYEPFVGGGAIWLALEHNKNVIADIIPDLINMYECVKQNPDKVFAILEKLQNNEKSYYQIRNFDRNPNFPRTSKEFKAARYIYTCITAFGSTTYNSDGQMNQSYFKKPFRKKLVSKKDYFGLVERLKYTDIYKQSFEDTLKLPQQGDFVYLDPPYMYTKYIHYWLDKFTITDLERLKKCCDDLTKRGVKFAMSHLENKEVDELFEDYNQRDMNVQFFIKHAQGDNEKATETLITNF